MYVPFLFCVLLEFIVTYLFLAVLRILWLPIVQGIKMVVGCASTDRQANCSVRKKHGGCWWCVYEGKQQKLPVWTSVQSIQVTFLQGPHNCKVFLVTHAGIFVSFSFAIDLVVDCVISFTTRCLVLCYSCTNQGSVCSLLLPLKGYLRHAVTCVVISYQRNHFWGYVQKEALVKGPSYPNCSVILWRQK